MSAISTLFSQHPYWATATMTWISNYGISAFVNALDAPTKDSSPFYRFFFKFITAVLAQNPTRAANTVVENSPNFQDAIRKGNGNATTQSSVLGLSRDNPPSK